MARSDRQRVLAAVMFTDVVAYSVRVQRDEAATVAAVARDLATIGRVGVQFGGKVLKNTGDGLLLLFTSAAQAVQCAVHLQNLFAAAAVASGTRDPLLHRMGVHLGDVYVTDADVVGDGVNVAARLLAEADAGGVCFSQTVYDVVRQQLAVEPTFLGPRALKNIAAPVPAYQIRGVATASRVPDALPTPAVRRRIVTLILGAATGVAVGFAVADHRASAAASRPAGSNVVAGTNGAIQVGVVEMHAMGEAGTWADGSGATAWAEFAAPFDRPPRVKVSQVIAVPADAPVRVEVHEDQVYRERFRVDFFVDNANPPRSAAIAYVATVAADPGVAPP